MATLSELLALSARDHDHLCPRQVLGVRMGMLAGELMRLPLPQVDKRLLTFIEVDGCFADGIAAATGCTVGHRTLRVMDYGKVAATFVDTRSGEAVRIAPHPNVRQAAYAHAPNARSRWHAQLEAYQIMPDEELLVAQPVALNLSLGEIVSRPGVRVNCELCGEEIINEREIVRESMILCRGCAEPAYYLPVMVLPASTWAARPLEAAQGTKRG